MEKLPALRKGQKSSEETEFDASTHALWARLSAFLTLKSSNTQRTYLSVIHEWCDFLGAPAGSAKAAKLMLSCTDMEAVRYKLFLESQPGQKPRFASQSKLERRVSVNRFSAKKKDGLQSTLANATVAKKFAALRRIYRMLISYNLGVTQNPFDTDKVPPPPSRSGQKRPTEMIEFELVKEIINRADPSTPKGLRDRAVLSVLFGGGLRRSEAVSLRIGDVKKTPRGTVYLHLRSTKAKVDSDQALPVWAGKTVMELVRQRRKSGAQSGDYLFVSYRGNAGLVPTEKPFSDSGLYKLFKSYCMQAGAGEFLSPHSARATAITKLLADGVSHREVQEFSRHASVQMVEVYDKRRIGVDDNPAKDLDYD